jgi:hypothetical protein
LAQNIHYINIEEEDVYVLCGLGIISMTKKEAIQKITLWVKLHRNMDNIGGWCLYCIHNGPENRATAGCYFKKYMARVPAMDSGKELRCIRVIYPGNYIKE